MTSMARYFLCLVGVALVFTTINVVHVSRMPSCCDYIYSYGFPLPFFVKGGFGGIRQFVWNGLLIDLIALTLFAWLMSWVWQKISLRNTSRIGRT
jgi:hypothetical protein